VPNAQLLVPLATTVANGLDDSCASNHAKPEAARCEILAAHLLVFLMLGHEPRDSGHCAQDVNPHDTFDDLLELLGKGVWTLELEGPDRHVQIKEHVGGKEIAPSLLGLEDGGEPSTQPRNGRTVTVLIACAVAMSLPPLVCY
jgi:hypothetical protein